MNLSDMIAEAQNGVLLFDGAMGTMVAERGAARPNELADLLVLSNPQVITGIHADYVSAGSDVVPTNTFNANARNLAGRASVAEVYAAAVRCARDANARWVAGDIGPLGELLDPYGDIEEDEAFDLFAEQAAAAQAAGADLIVIETMSDLNEAGIALTAARERTSLPVVVTMSFDANGFTFFGVTPAQAAKRLTELGAHAVGMNCSTGPEDMLALVSLMREATDIPIAVQPNAGLPQIGAGGKAFYDMDPSRFAAAVEQMVRAGARIIGGCCGTTPAHVAALHAMRCAR